MIAIKLWSRKLAGLKVELLPDNTTCVSVINSQYSTNHFMQQCLQERLLLLALFNIQLVVRGCDNWLADSLSRFHTGDFSVQFHALSTSLQLSECSVPDSLFHFTLVPLFEGFSFTENSETLLEYAFQIQSRTFQEFTKRNTRTQLNAFF